MSVEQTLFNIQRSPSVDGKKYPAIYKIYIYGLFHLLQLCARAGREMM